MTKRKVVYFLIIILAALGGIAAFTIFFDQAVIVRKGTIYRRFLSEKVVALTFDDGPSLAWTPKILDVLKNSHAKATFFMIGNHVAKYPEVARRVASEGHQIGNHTYDHHVLIYYKTEELEKEIKDAEKVIRDVTGVTTQYFRPPKAWLTKREKKQIKELGYEIVLWSLNSKDWVSFDDKYIIRYILHNIQPGDILLFHDSGGVFSTEGGNREETIKVIPRLVEELRRRGYKFVTISQLMKSRGYGD